MGESYGTIEAVASGQRAEKKENKENPIIIIPGVMGSRFFKSDIAFDDTTRIWDPVLPKGFDTNDIIQSDFIKRIAALGSQLASQEIFVRKVENQNYDTIENADRDVIKYGREYGAQNTYQSLVDTLCANFPKRKIYFFSYDWRKSNIESAMKLFIVLSRLGIEKADFVCHSMGGLVVSEFYNMYRHNNQIDKIITCATPYEGAPKLINSIMNKDVLGEGALGGADWSNDLADLLLGTIGGLSKQLKASFQGVVELLPTKNYVTMVPMQELMHKYNVKYHRSEESGRVLSYEEYVERCNAIFNQEEKAEDTQENIYDGIKEFQESLLAENGCNRLLEYQNAYFAVGIKQKTIISIRFNPESPSINKRLYEGDLKYGTCGDGTVPYLSATMMGHMPDIAELGKRCLYFAQDHTGIIKDSKVIRWISDILRDGYSDEKGEDIIH